MRTDSKFLKIILVLCFLGVLVSGWLLSMHIRFNSGEAGLTESCTIMSAALSSQGCANVAVSKYSDVLGVPVAAIGMSFYFALFFLTFWSIRNYQAAYEALYVGFFLSTVSIVVSVVMYLIAKIMLNSFCIGCGMLYLINLAIWPCFVRHLNLRWSNALFANLELVRQKDLHLVRSRITKSLAVMVACLVIFSIIGVAAEKLQVNDNEVPAQNDIVEQYKSAPTVFLPPEAIGGVQSKGSENPIMDIVEFADFQCPACRSAALFARPFLMRNNTTVRFTFHSYPLDESCNRSGGRHAFACSATRVAICAGEQGLFWKAHDYLYDHQQDLSEALLQKVPGEVGADNARIAECVKRPDTETKIQKDIQWGEAIGLEFTPTLVVNGKRLGGAHTPQEWETLLKYIQNQKK